MTPTNSQLDLFDVAYFQTIDTTTQVTRIPGTPDAPCHCRKDRCEWPWCKPDDERNA